MSVMHGQCPLDMLCTKCEKQYYKVATNSSIPSHNCIKVLKQRNEGFIRHNTLF